MEIVVIASFWDSFSFQIWNIKQIYHHRFFFNVCLKIVLKDWILKQNSGQTVKFIFSLLEFVRLLGYSSNYSKRCHYWAGNIKQRKNKTTIFKNKSEILRTFWLSVRSLTHYSGHNIFDKLSFISFYQWRWLTRMMIL